MVAVWLGDSKSFENSLQVVQAIWANDVMMLLNFDAFITGNLNGRTYSCIDSLEICTSLPLKIALVSETSQLFYRCKFNGCWRQQEKYTCPKSWAMNIQALLPVLAKILDWLSSTGNCHSITQGVCTFVFPGRLSDKCSVFPCEEFPVKLLGIRGCSSMCLMVHYRLVVVDLHWLAGVICSHWTLPQLAHLEFSISVVLPCDFVHFLTWRSGLPLQRDVSFFGSMSSITINCVFRLLLGVKYHTTA